MLGPSWTRVRTQLTNTTMNTTNTKNNIRMGIITKETRFEMELKEKKP